LIWLKSSHARPPLPAAPVATQVQGAHISVYEKGQHRRCNAASRVRRSLARANDVAAEGPRYFGKFNSLAEAERWIAGHRWLTKQNLERQVSRLNND